MSNYDFKDLSPPEFERLTRDLLQAAWNKPLESFKVGPDGGIDLRDASNGDHTIIQCKHYLRSGLKALLRDLGAEVAKARALKPKRYVISTSVSLSPANKKAIVELFTGVPLAVGDIFGQDDLNNLLGLHPEVEKRHYKLWLASRAVLDRVIHNSIETQSAFHAEIVREQIRRYVANASHDKAIAALDKEGVVILSGPPGVGKTTLANILLYRHVHAGYRPVVMQRDIEEGQKLLQDGAKLIFHFDDFMGATFLGEHGSIMGKNEDRAILQFIAMVRASPKARLVLTTREHLLMQAFNQSERFKNSDLLDHRIVIQMNDYSQKQKARILYNHIVFSDLPPEYRQALLQGEFYLEIIKHPKFNPRLIEWLSSYRRVKDRQPADYQSFVKGLLSDPSEIWRHAYDKQISDPARSLLLALFSLGGEAPVGLLEEAFRALHNERATRYRLSRRPEDFREAVRELNGAFIKPTKREWLGVLDPSVLDLMGAVLRQTPDNAIDIVLGATNTAQVSQMWAFAKSGGSSSILTRFRADAEMLAPAIRRVVLKNRRVDMGGGTIGYNGPSFEARLTLVLTMASALRSPHLAQVARDLADHLLDWWKDEWADINDTVSLLSTLRNGNNEFPVAIPDFDEVAQAELIESCRAGCDPQELVDVLSVVDLAGANGAADRAALIEGFNTFRRSSFERAVTECRGEAFGGLIESLREVGEALAIPLDREIATVEAAAQEADEYEERRADQAYDEWKDNQAYERENDNDVRELFSSLRTDD